MLGKGSINCLYTFGEHLILYNHYLFVLVMGIEFFKRNSIFLHELLIKKLRIQYNLTCLKIISMC